MLRQLRSDLYRLRHGKLIWVMAAILCLLSVLNAVVMWLAESQVLEQLLDTGGVGGLIASQLSQNLDLAQMLGQMVVSNGLMLMLLLVTSALLAVSDFDTGYAKGMLAARRSRWVYFTEKMLLLVTTALIAIVDFDTGYAKGMLAARRSRWVFFTEKLLLIALVDLFLIAVGCVSYIVAMLVAGFGFAEIGSKTLFARWLALIWLALIAYSFFVAFLTWITRSKSFGVAMAAVLGSGALFLVIIGITAVLPEGGISDVLVRISEWLPMSSFNELGKGLSCMGDQVWNSDGGSFISQLIGSGTPSGDQEGLSTHLHILITFASMTVTFVLGTWLFAARRDV